MTWNNHSIQTTHSPGNPRDMLDYYKIDSQTKQDILRRHFVAAA
jgi:hypothetical protein